MKPEVAWAMRPTGSLSNLYLTDEQLKAVYAWLDMLAGYTLDEAREAVAGLTDLDECNWVNSDCSCMEHYCFCEHRGKAQALAAIDALKGEQA